MSLFGIFVFVFSPLFLDLLQDLPYLFVVKPAQSCKLVQQKIFVTVHGLVLGRKSTNEFSQGFALPFLTCGNWKRARPHAFFSTSKHFEQKRFLIVTVYKMKEAEHAF